MRRSQVFIWVTLIFMASVSFGGAADEGSWTGWIADENCAKDYEKSATAEHQACAQACLKRGGKLALSTPEGHFLLDVDPGLAQVHLGHEVVVKGELDTQTNTIKVTTVTMSDLSD